MWLRGRLDRRALASPREPGAGEQAVDLATKPRLPHLGHLVARPDHRLRQADERRQIDRRAGDDDVGGRGVDRAPSGSRSYWTASFFAAAVVFFGSVSSRTPSAYFALASASLMSCPREKLRISAP